MHSAQNIFRFANRFFTVAALALRIPHGCSPILALRRLSAGPVLHSPFVFLLSQPPKGSSRMKFFVRLSVLFTVLVLAPLAFAQQPAPRAITIEDYFQIHEVRDPQFSPDAKWVAYTVKTVLLKEDKNEERIWMVPAAGGAPLALTAEGESSTHARWSPDGRFIAFLSARKEGKSQVWLLNRLGGEAERLTDTPQDFEDFA